ncbi:sigma factor [Dactylosporangium sp. NPDC000555]|uniref:RNA polymerase sigma factor n=1 Tax=Dactylosporangium sp. NPDC000555 TaxID=3154260 RepID=UPI003318C815
MRVSRSLGDAVLPVSLGDAEIIGHSRTHPELFGALFERHSGTLFRYACRRVGPEVAEDVVAETFLAAFRQRARYDLNRSDARPWLLGILVREVSRHRRKETSQGHCVFGRWRIELGLYGVTGLCGGGQGG